MKVNHVHRAPGRVSWRPDVLPIGQTIWIVVAPAAVPTAVALVMPIELHDSIDGSGCKAVRCHDIGVGAVVEGHDARRRAARRGCQEGRQAWRRPALPCRS